MIKYFDSLTQINVPDFDSTQTLNISFNTTVNSKKFVFNCVYKEDISQWVCWVTMPDLSVRYFGIDKPNVMNWFTQKDYGIILLTYDKEITKDNLSGQTIGIFEWRQ